MGDHMKHIHGDSHLMSFEKYHRYYKHKLGEVLERMSYF